VLSILAWREARRADTSAARDRTADENYAPTA
jgi:hypothetical protein